MLKRISRNTNQAGPDKFHVYSGAVNYKRQDGVFDEISPGRIDVENGTIFRNKGVVKSKFYGRTVIFTPDADANWQVGVAVKSIKLVNRQLLLLTKTTMNNLSEKTLPCPLVTADKPFYTQMADGAFEVETQKRGSRFLIPATNKLKDFEIEFVITPSKDLKVAFASGQVFFEYKDKVVLVFGRPKLLDENMEFIGANPETGVLDLVDCELTDNHDGTWAYTKIPGKDFVGATLPANYFIDADVVYVESGSGITGRVDTSNWANRRDTIDGTYIDVDGSGYMGPFTTGYLARGHGFFDCSALAGTVTDAIIYIYSRVTTNPSAVLQKSTADLPLVLGDFGSIVGGIGGDTLSASFIPNADGWNTVSITDLSYVESALGSNLKIAIVDYTYDYLNVDPGATNHYWYCEFTTAGKEMYVELTIEATASGPNNVMLI